MCVPDSLSPPLPSSPFPCPWLSLSFYPRHFLCFGDGFICVELCSMSSCCIGFTPLVPSVSTLYFPDKEPTTQGHMLICIGLPAGFLLLFHLLDYKSNYFSPSWFLMRKDCFPGTISLEWLSLQDKKKSCSDSVFCLYPSPPPPLLNICLEAIKNTKQQYFKWCHLHF